MHTCRLRPQRFFNTMNRGSINVSRSTVHSLQPGEPCQRERVRLIHIHGCWNLYFRRSDIKLDSELCIKMLLKCSVFEVLTDTETFYDSLIGDNRPSWYGTPVPYVTQTDRTVQSFSLNPKSSLDNRVDIDDWEKVAVPMLKMANLLNRLHVTRKTFIKIDTQGYENHVFAGLHDWLIHNGDWLIKMEFAPQWLLSQGTDPLILLNYLGNNFEIAEYPARVPYGISATEELFRFPIRQNDHAAFLEYVTSLDRDKKGWVDLIVRPLPIS